MSEAAVVITGVGVMSPLGGNMAETWSALMAGRGARRPIDLFSTEGCRCREGAVATLPAAGKSERRLSRATRLALPALGEALRQAGLEGSALAAGAPLSISTTGGAMEWGEGFVRGALAGGRKGLLAQVARYQPQQQALDFRKTFGLRGPATLIGNACASGANAIGHGVDLIRCGAADCVITGGYEALTELIFDGFDCLQALSPTACRPFDEKRDGLMLGEGAAFLILESAEAAERRGAVVVGRIHGYGHRTDLHHLTQPAPSGAALAAAMGAALAEAGLPAESVRHINAHGTGTAMNDGVEVAAYGKVFGDHLPDVTLTSTKAAVGHTLGAAGCLEAVFALEASRAGKAPPQLNNVEPISAVASCVAETNRTFPPGSPVMSVNLGFGGSNAALVLST